MQNRISSAIAIISGDTMICGGQGSRAECRSGNSLLLCFSFCALSESNVRGSSVADSAIDKLQ